MNLNHIRHNLDLISVLIIYFIIGFFLINYYQYSLNADSISYITIAQEYLNRNFADAVNGYWSPLFSWLLIPFLPFSSSPQFNIYLARILSLITGVLTIIGINLLISRFKIDKTSKTLVLFSLIPIILSFLFGLISPDLLVTTILIYYLYIIFDPDYPNKKYIGILCGILGALAYLSKSYALPLFLAHFVLFNLIYYFKSTNRKKQRKIFKNLILGLTIFFIISGFWIALISDKYGKSTFGTAGDYNHELVGPQSNGDFVYYHGLIKPPNKFAVSAWEDPSYFKMKSWNAFGSWDNFKYQITLILDNVVKIINIFEVASLFSIIIFIASIIIVFKSNIKKTSKNKLIYLITTITLYLGGYSLVLIEPRYLWLVNILLLIMGFYLLNLLFEIGSLKGTVKNILLAFLILSFVVNPINALILNLDIGKDSYTLSEALEHYKIHGNLASNDEWRVTDYLAYYTSSKYYGQTKQNESYNNLKKELKVNNIDYYLVWGNSKENIKLSHDFKEVTNGTIDQLRIYSIKN
ncbi:ArnT family glycosyltransferase [Methanobacterium sp. MBAC-LM]|uniref:ArnT family glycosyltransferase n=1 Tax=Methanobacterium sp. MBAC-LM TaxID=3412034 RepID=UPI003C74ED33